MSCFPPKVFFFSDFVLFHFFMSNFPLQGAVQGLRFLQNADSKPSFIQERTNPSLGILGLMKKRAGVVFVEERDLGKPGSSSSTYIFPFQKANERQLPELNRNSPPLLQKGPHNHF